MKEIKRMNKTGRPVLVGTTSVEQSEFLASQLQKDGTPYPPCANSSRIISLCLSVSAQQPAGILPFLI